MSKITDDIVFYGQDLTSLDHACVVWYTEKGDASQRLKGNEYLKDFLWALMQDLDECKEGLLVSHSDKEIDDKDDYKLCKFNPLVEEKTDAEKRQFGSIVGIIGKIYTKKATSSHLISFVNREDSKEKLQDVNEDFAKIIRRLLSSSKKEEQIRIKLEIYSRFDNFDAKEPEKSTPFFLASMLLN